MVTVFGFHSVDDVGDIYTLSHNLRRYLGDNHTLEVIHFESLLNFLQPTGMEDTLGKKLERLQYDYGEKNLRAEIIKKYLNLTPSTTIIFVIGINTSDISEFEEYGSIVSVSLFSDIV